MIFAGTKRATSDGPRMRHTAETSDDTYAHCRRKAERSIPGEVGETGVGPGYEMSPLLRNSSGSLGCF